MLIFQQSGRLGNQIFQYAALRQLCRSEEELILLGFSELQSVFTGIKAKIINSNSPRWERAIYYRIYRAMSFLAQKKIITTIKESNKRPEIILDFGISKEIFFAEKAYFQSELFFQRETIDILKLRPELLSFAQQLLLNLTQGRTSIFVHIRRGDYLTWRTKSHPAVLPASYYQNCINIICTKIHDPFFVFVSDDPFYVKDVFGDLENAYISYGSSIEDFAVMTQCKGGILSASSFAWWAAYLARMSQPDSFFLAPKYWIDHRLSSWFPSFIESSFLDYVDVYSNPK
ncbi:alpha-1,2-fucosyltransferase [Pseudanabaena sp. 'Roaring Creek']|uniref:alpha-1,2-fucosyltransferase n=1 Tax=Pseudanabaena sp. 'Roaring Creek' TaxID=1681830 RepID=UPI0006D7CB85|nr:alpha-1,2-fucosyltransferase [Pseudanabaena sp. 'Roaring Creek']